MALAGGGWVAGLSGLNVAIQVHAARWVAARAIALLQAALFLGLASGSLIWGLLADRFGLGGALILSGASMLATLVLGRWLPIVSNDAVDLSPAPIPASDAPVAQRRTYRPRAARQAEFQDRMRQLERARRRDGAVHWSLRQMADGGWVEEFAFNHADDARRHAARRTREDERLEQDIAELLEGCGE
ncbi:MFS transporter [Sphingomonas colocasiae]|uniref:MFS transporter n=2 Tax=Sphingomonas colocasiae TaxID=1848973 RepID=A0ABS7PS54_9SPHN|nr:MFS transporter [Sphingomonas colocasiae]